MVACADANRAVSDRCAHHPCTELGRGAFYLYVVLGACCAEERVANLETYRSSRRDIPGAGLAHSFLRGPRPAVWPFRSFVQRFAAD